MANDNPDWARLDVGRVDTLRGASLSVNQNSTVNFDSSFTPPLLWTLRYNVTSFNCFQAGNTIGVVGSPSGTYFRLVDVVTPPATNLLFIWGEDIVFSSAIDLTLALPGDTSYQLQVRSGPTSAQTVWGITIYAGAQL